MQKWKFYFVVIDERFVIDAVCCEDSSNKSVPWEKDGLLNYRFSGFTMADAIDLLRESSNVQMKQAFWATVHKHLWGKLLKSF